MTETGRLFQACRRWRDLVQFWNSMRKYNVQGGTLPPPNTDEQGSITSHLNLLQELQRSGRERVFYDEDSEVPELLAAVRGLAGEDKHTDFPQVVAVVYGSAAFYHNETLEEVAKNKPLNPWDRQKLNPGVALRLHLALQGSLKTQYPQGQQGKPRLEQVVNMRAGGARNAAETHLLRQVDLAISEKRRVLICCQ